jgi:hypothetical protein
MNWPLTISLTSLASVALVVLLGVLVYLPPVSNRTIDAALDAVRPVRDPMLTPGQRRWLLATRAEDWLIANGKTPGVYDSQHLNDRICRRIDRRPDLLET